jgi:hypothetical protein
MSDLADRELKETAAERLKYEKPKLTHVGNARELLASSSGTKADVPLNFPGDTRP